MLKGTILKERYCIVDIIGKGGGGQVYLARDMEIGSLWAVKVLPAERQKEARILIHLNHASMPKAVDFFEEGGNGFLVMEYIRGKSLAALLAEGRRFSHSEVISFTQTILSILSLLHSQKPPLIYGDIKPANLMLSENGNLYLVDFGSTIQYHKEAGSRICEGTPGYAAPEQYQGKASPASDLYALGKTMRLLLSGSSFSHPKSCLVFFFRHPALSLFFSRCTRKNEKKRHANACAAIKSWQQNLAWEHRLQQVGMAGIGALFLILALVLSMLLPSGSGADTEHFTEDLTRATEAYYGETDEVSFKEAELRLRTMLGKYHEPVRQSALLLLLARNAEAAGQIGQAARYYEQLTAYAPADASINSAYGLFLIRIGQKENSKKLWQDFSVFHEGEDGECRDYRLWKKAVE